MTPEPYCPGTLPCHPGLGLKDHSFNEINRWRTASFALQMSHMPLPTDEKLLSLGQDLLKQFDTIFGLHPGFRPAHARGFMLAALLRPTRKPHP